MQRRAWPCLMVFVIACGHHHSGDGIDAGTNVTQDACDGLACFQFDCSAKNLPPTTVSGTVYAPNGTLPLFGVNVYVPAMDPGPLPAGVTCDQCNNGLLGGSLASTTTDEAGHFSLTNVPATTDVPIVIQSGKWRRQLKLPNVAACQELPIVTADTTFPKSVTDKTPNTTGVDLPQIAISTGNADALECLILKLGIDPTEITPSTGTGHVHLYANTSSGGVGATQFKTGWPGGSGMAFTDSQAMWNSSTNLAKYDIVMLSCEGGQYPTTKTQAAIQNIHDYAGIGGRVFMSHWHNIWIAGEDKKPSHGMSDWESIATFNLEAANPDPDSLTATIDEASNPKGMSFATWMQNVGGSGATTRDLVPITGARDTCTANDPMKSERWIYLDPMTSPGVSSVQDLEFTTPNDQPEDQRCGKVVFSDMHVSSDSSSSAGTPYPGGCSTGPMSPQEKALSFIFFDISSCVGQLF